MTARTAYHIHKFADATVHWAHTFQGAMIPSDRHPRVTVSSEWAADCQTALENLMAAKAMLEEALNEEHPGDEGGGAA